MNKGNMNGEIKYQMNQNERVFSKIVEKDKFEDGQRLKKAVTIYCSNGNRMNR